MSRGPVEATTSGARVRVRVTPKAAREGVGGVVETAGGDAAIKVAVTAAPEDGKANQAVIKLLAKAWGLPKSSLSVVVGPTSREKVLSVAGDPVETVRTLTEWIARGTPT